MPEPTPSDPPTEIAFGRPGLISVPLLIRLAWLLALVAAGYFSSGGPEHYRALGFASEFVIILVVALGWRVWLHYRGGTPPIRFGPEIITLPRGSASRRVVMVRYQDVRSATVMGTGWRARLIIDTARGPFVYPLNSMAQPDSAARLVRHLQSRVEAVADGGAHWQAIAARQALARDLAGATAWVTWSTASVLCLCYVLQRIATAQDGALGLIDAGANAGFLVRGGEWFRLVTANLLHISPNHLAGNGLMLFVLGTMLERLIGHRQFLIVLLATGIASEAASTAYALSFGGNVFSVGASGILFGILGVLAAVTWRFRRDLPGGYRLSARVWIFLVGINMLLLPQLQAQVDKAAHAGGLVAGLGMGALLVWGCRDLRDVRARHVTASRAALAGLALVWVAGLGAAALHARNGQARAADRYALAHDMLGADRFPPGVQNLIAWEIAIDAAAPRAALSDARLLAHRGTEEAARLTTLPANAVTQRANAATLAAVTDTEAALDYRLGYPDEAAAIEADVESPGSEERAHMMLFLEHAVPFALNANPTWPKLWLDHGVVRLNVPVSPAQGGALYALLHRDGALLGMMLVHVPPGFSGAQVLPLPVRRNAPSEAPPATMWIDGRTQVDIARYDGTACHCGAESLMGPSYTAYNPRISPLPQ